jgi:single-stranded-DNA-specific exonuclease
MKWVLVASDDEIVTTLARNAGLHPLVARLMVNRGITNPTTARAFLECELSTLSDPGIFSQMPETVERIRRAVSGHEHITVYGDYDVDGVTGTSLLYLVLRDMGAEVSWYIPDRMTEGYGLNETALQAIKTSGTGLVISVDCGISAVHEAEVVRSLGIDLIITDHHEISGGNGSNDINLPNAYSVLHPLLLIRNVSPEVHEQVSCLTGVGIAFKLVQALLDAGADDKRLQAYFDLVALGTVADVGRIRGENRTLVRHGLELLSSDQENLRPGIAALKQVSGLAGKKISAGTVGFSIAPRINASGRLERADTAFRLLTTDSVEEAQSLASELDSVNRERQAVEEDICEEARKMCRQVDIPETGALVLSSENWHPGVIGIVASRIADEFYRPAALISLNKGIGKGSARSIPGFDLYGGLAACSDLLLGFGGHRYAAGFTIAQENILQFRERLHSIALERLGTDGFTRILSVDSGVTLDELSNDLVQEIEKMAPFGQGNPEPRFGARDLDVLSSRIVGNNHLKLRLRQQNGVALDAIAFNQGRLLGRLVRDGVRLAAVFTPRINTWNGKTAVELEIKDIRAEG